jgi:hypothetical protein
MKEGVALIVVLLVAIAGIFFWNDIKAAFTGDPGNKQELVSGKEKNKDKDKDKEQSGDQVEGQPVQVVERFDLPEDLKEVSGIHYRGNGLFACVQDESGVIYFYNTESGSIEKQISFAGAGDFEGIAQANEVIYVIRADGRLYEIRNLDASKPVVKEYETGLTVKDNVESLCYDVDGKRLLLTGKDENKSTGKREVYAFDPVTGKTAPVFSIDLNSELMAGKSKKGSVKFSPSGMGIHPVTKDIYITDGPAAAVYKLNSMGKITGVYKLDSREVPQAEGISFSPGGEIFISTEGPKGPGAILKVQLN